LGRKLKTDADVEKPPTNNLVGGFLFLREGFILHFG
jgi:hypothetical protein